MSTSNKPHDLNYATPASDAPIRWSGFVKGIGALTALAGVITAFAGTAGVDDKVQIMTGCLIAGFGITWTILGQILKSVEGR
jgi:hypothetical protein